MIPDALAAARSTPFPWETESERPFGRQTITTGMPMTSRPVITAHPRDADRGEDRLEPLERGRRLDRAVRPVEA